MVGLRDVPRHSSFKDLQLQTGAKAHIDTKGLSGGLANRPPDRPPDPENGSVGAVGTASGAEVQSVLQRTTPNHRKNVAHASPTTPIRPSAPLRIVIEATASGQKVIARLGDRVLCVTVWPFVKSARLLLAEGYPADTVLEMWRPNTREWALRGRLGAAAATVIDGETGSRSAKNGAPARDSEQGGQ